MRCSRPRTSHANIWCHRSAYSQTCVIKPPPRAQVSEYRDLWHRIAFVILATIFATTGTRAEESKDHRPPHKIVAPTGSEFAAAMDRYHKWGDDAATKLKIKFETLETQHFLIFTDWDPREYAFLRENVENAYSVVSGQFDRSASDNVFIGKLPIFMITSKSNFDRFTKDISRMTDAPKDLAGYYRCMPDGFG